MKDNNASFINLNYECNNNCLSCIMERKFLYSKTRTIEKIKKKIDHILSYSDHIEFNGGEPTIRKDFFEILKYASQKKAKEIGIISNGRMFSYPQFVKKLTNIQINNLKIEISLYGPDSKIHDSITRAPGSFNQAIKGIRNLIKNNISVELRVIINKLNYRYLEEIAEFIISNFNKDELLRIVFINIKYFGIAFDNQNLISYKITEAFPYVNKAVNKLLNKDFKINLFHFPHCILPKDLWDLSLGVTAEKPEIVFPKECNSCSQKLDCSGIWKSYHDIFGSEELKTIK